MCEQKVLNCSSMCLGCGSLREAQALLVRRTLAKGGRGGKMASALRNHIEKERKKLLTVTSPSSLIQRSTRRLQLQRGQYGVHFPPPQVRWLTGKLPRER